MMPHKTSLETLGVVYYRQGAWREAITALKKSAELQSEADLHASVPLFLAMAYWRLDEHEQARTWHEKAVESMKGKPINNEVKRFRAEADELLGIVNQAEVAKEDLHSPPANIDVK